jgi:hypothetical protein
MGVGTESEGGRGLHAAAEAMDPVAQ